MAKNFETSFVNSLLIDGRYELQKCPTCEKISYKHSETKCNGCQTEVQVSDWLPITPEEIHSNNSQIASIISEAELKILTLEPKLPETVALLLWGVGFLGLYSNAVLGMKISWALTALSLALVGYYLSMRILKKKSDLKIASIISETTTTLHQVCKLTGQKPLADAGPIPAIILARKEFQAELMRRTVWFAGLLFVIALLPHARAWYRMREYGEKIQDVSIVHSSAMSELQGRLRKPKADGFMRTSADSVDDFTRTIAKIDISKCPLNFQLEFIELVRKWQKMIVFVKDNAELVAPIQSIMDATQILNFSSSGTILVSDIQMQYIRLNLIAKEYDTFFTQSGNR